MDCGHIYVSKGKNWGSTSSPHIGDVMMSLFFTLDFVLDASAASFVKLLNGTLKYVGPVELAQYFVRSTIMQQFDYEDRSGVRVLVVFGRRLLSNILTVYVPTVLLNTMGHITVYFKPFFFEAIITVNLTVMLVLTTM